MAHGGPEPCMSERVSKINDVPFFCLREHGSRCGTAHLSIVFAIVDSEPPAVRKTTEPSPNYASDVRKSVTAVAETAIFT
jgi:hypothetical protein